MQIIRGRQMKMTKEQEQGFITFWTLWQKRVAKADAMKAWMQIDPREYPAIFAAVPVHFKQPTWSKDGMTYVPYPASWLRGRRWEDELSVQKQTSKLENVASMVMDAIQDPLNGYMPSFGKEVFTALYSVMRKYKINWSDLQKRKHDDVFLKSIRQDFLTEMQKQKS